MLKEVYGFLTNKCKQKVIPAKAIKVITGNATIEASKSKTINIEYPENFNAENCVLLSLGLSGATSVKGYNFEGYYVDSSDILMNAFRRRLNLAEDNITLTIFNPNTSENTVNYKLALLRTDL